MLNFFNRHHPSALFSGLLLLLISVLFSYSFGNFSWLTLDESILPIGGRLLSRIPVVVGYPLSYVLLIGGCIFARLLVIRYVSGLSQSYLIVFFVPLLVGGLGLGGHNLLPVLVALLFLELALAMLLNTTQSPYVLSRVFLISVLTGFASLFYLPTLLFAFAPILILLNRNYMGVRGVLLILLGVSLTGVFIYFLCWLFGGDVLEYYPVTRILTFTPTDVSSWVQQNPVRPLYILFVFLLWLLMLPRLHNPHKIHKMSYLLVRNLFISDFLLSLLSLLVVRDPFYILPFIFFFLCCMICYTFLYVRGTRSNIVFFLVLTSGVLLHLF